MTRDDIISMAKEAGFSRFVVVQNGFNAPSKVEVFSADAEGSLTKFAQLVAAHERKRCIEECNDVRTDLVFHKPYEDYKDGHLDACNECIWAIEALT